MKFRNRFPAGKARSAGVFSWIKAPLFCWVLALWLLAACAPKVAPPLPAPVYPTRVITHEGVAFMVHGFRLPGTRQEFTLRFDGSKQWMALNLMQSVRFIGSAKKGYRRAEIFLTSGERLQTEVFVNTIVEGSTDLGYWNMHLSGIDSLDLGSD